MFDWFFLIQSEFGFNYIGGMKNVEFIKQLEEFEVDFPEIKDEEEYLEMDIFTLEEIDLLLNEDLSPIKKKKEILLKQNLEIEEILNQKLKFDKMDTLNIMIHDSFKKLSELFISDFDPKSLLSLFTEILKNINSFLSPYSLFNKFLEIYIEPFLFFLDAFQIYKLCNHLITKEQELLFRIEQPYIHLETESIINKKIEILKYRNLKDFNENFYLSSNIKVILKDFLLFQGNFKISKKYLQNLMILSSDYIQKEESDFVQINSKFSFINLPYDFEEIDLESYYNLDLIILFPSNIEYEIINDKFIRFKNKSKIYWIKK